MFQLYAQSVVLLQCVCVSTIQYHLCVLLISSMCHHVHSYVDPDVQGAHRSLGVMEFKIQTVPHLKGHRIRPRSWKVMENRLNGCHIFNLCRPKPV